MPLHLLSLFHVTWDSFNGPVCGPPVCQRSEGEIWRKWQRFMWAGGLDGWMNVGTLMWDQGLSSASTISLLPCWHAERLLKTQPSCKLIEGGDFLTVTATKNKLLFEKTVDHPATFVPKLRRTRLYSWKFSDACQNESATRDVQSTKLEFYGCLIVYSMPLVPLRAYPGFNKFHLTECLRLDKADEAEEAQNSEVSWTVKVKVNIHRL